MVGGTDALIVIAKAHRKVQEDEEEFHVGKSTSQKPVELMAPESWGTVEHYGLSGPLTDASKPEF